MYKCSYLGLPCPSHGWDGAKICSECLPSYQPPVCVQSTPESLLYNESLTFSNKVWLSQSAWKHFGNPVDKPHPKAWLPSPSYAGFLSHYTLGPKIRPDLLPAQLCLCCFYPWWTPPDSSMPGLTNPSFTKPSQVPPVVYHSFLRSLLHVHAWTRAHFHSTSGEQLLDLSHLLRLLRFWIAGIIFASVSPKGPALGVCGMNEWTSPLVNKFLLTESINYISAHHSVINRVIFTRRFIGCSPSKIWKISVAAMEESPECLLWGRAALERAVWEPESLPLWEASRLSPFVLLSQGHNDYCKSMQKPCLAFCSNPSDHLWDRRKMTGVRSPARPQGRSRGPAYRQSRLPSSLLPFCLAK